MGNEKKNKRKMGLKLDEPESCVRCRLAAPGVYSRRLMCHANINVFYVNNYIDARAPFCPLRLEAAR